MSIIVSMKQKTYHCGTLSYTQAALIAVFAWMLWGDFCFTLMDTIVNSTLPLKLKALNAPNWLIGMILSAIPNILGMTVCPYISFKSDRYRSKWGRRIPFILWTIPFLCLSLLLLGWSDHISLLLQKHVLILSNICPATLTIALIGVFMALFQFFNMFVSSVFWYLFNDVIPPQFLARFVGLFRIVGIAAGAFYNYFVFRFAESNMREIFTGAAILYFIGLGMMCLRVKEGEYPPLEGENADENKGLSGIKIFFNECFKDKFYWLIFTFSSFLTISTTIGLFNVFFYREMGLTLDNIGKFSAITGIAALLAMYFTAIFVDRWHPLRTFMYLCIFSVVGYLMNWVWVFVTLPGNYYFWLCLGIGLISAFQYALTTACGLPLFMRLFPKSRYGQFCSAMVIVRSFCCIVAGLASGLFIDLMKWFFNGSDFAYRFNFIWLAGFTAGTAVFGVWMYIYWHRLGADRNYHPPAPWSPSGREEMEIVPSVGPQLRWLKLSLRLFNAIMALSVFGLPFLMWWMYHKGAMFAFRWYAILIVPLSLLAWLFWKLVEKSIYRDVSRFMERVKLHNGIPHHGVMMVFSIKFLLVLPIVAAQVIISIYLCIESGAVIFGLANVVNNFLLAGCVWILCRVERGRSITLDVLPGKNG